MVGIGKGDLTGPKEIQQGPLKQEDNRRKQGPGSKQKRKGVSHNFFRGLPVPLAPGNRKQGRPAAAEQIGERRDEAENGKGDTQAGQSICRGLGDVPDIHSVNDII